MTDIGYLYSNTNPKRGAGTSSTGSKIRPMWPFSVSQESTRNRWIVGVPLVSPRCAESFTGIHAIRENAGDAWGKKTSTINMVCLPGYTTVHPMVTLLMMVRMRACLIIDRLTYICTRQLIVGLDHNRSPKLHATPSWKKQKWKHKRFGSVTP